MKLGIFQVDAFTDHVFGGNPAAVCPLEKWLPASVMQQIAMENNLSETAFFVPVGKEYEIRWFAPEMEIDLCGHATLATAHVIFNHLNFGGKSVRFKYASGYLNVTREAHLLSMDFPAVVGQETPVTDEIVVSLGKKPREARKARDLLLLYDNEDEILSISPDFLKMTLLDCLGVIVTAPGKNADFVSRFFAPNAGINEDPVTGSAHCMLIPFWAERLNKTQMKAQQMSKRRGYLHCVHMGDRVLIAGKAITYMEGKIVI